MKTLKSFFESSYIRKHHRNDNFIKSVWYITEDEIFESFSELHDGMDVSIEVNFYLKGKNFEYTYENKLEIEERIEAYVASGLTPCILVSITNNDSKDDRRMHSYAMEALPHIDEYSLYDVKRGNKYLRLYLKFDENSHETKSKYHKKSARAFNEQIKYFRDNQYECNVSRVFLKDTKMNLMYTPGSLPVYFITLENKYKANLEMIDHLSESKSNFLNLLDHVSNIPDINKVNHSFDIKMGDQNTINVQFVVYIYEKG